MTHIFCISAGQLSTKKANSQLNRRNQYLNYGLLSLASVLKRDGLAPLVLHGHFHSPEAVFNLALMHGLQDTGYPVLLSIPSFYALSWAERFVSLAKSRIPSLRVIVGGRWVVGDQAERLQHYLRQADWIVPGLAEPFITELVTGSPAVQKAANSLSTLDYSLLHNRPLYQPSIEIARGCGMGCSFCQDKDSRLLPLKSPSCIATELKATLLDDDLIEMTPYFEAAMFVPNKRWTEALHNALDAAALKVRWRTEGRVDNLRPELIPALAKAGLTVLDLGLESASPIQLERMSKTRAPAKYLDRASRLLNACAENGIKVKTNVLLYAGENSETIAETTAWLDQHKDCIYGVSVSTVIVFGWPEEARDYLAQLEQLGATPDHSPCAGVTEMNLSAEMRYEDAKHVARFLTRRYMSAENYYTLKSFSYFPRDYRFSDFVVDLGHDTETHAFDASQIEEYRKTKSGKAA